MLERFSLTELLGFHKEVSAHHQYDRQIILALHFIKALPNIWHLKNRKSKTKIIYSSH